MHDLNLEELVEESKKIFDYISKEPVKSNLLGNIKEIYDENIQEKYEDSVLQFIAFGSVAINNYGLLFNNDENKVLDKIMGYANNLIINLPKLLKLFLVRNIESIDISLLGTEQFLDDLEPDDGEFIYRNEQEAEKLLEKLIDKVEEGKLTSKTVEYGIKLIEQYPFCFEAYSIVHEVLDYLGIDKSSKHYLEMGYNNVFEYFKKYGGEPYQIDWLYIENRPLVRLVNIYGYYLWRKGEPEKALGVLKWLFSKNYGDNIGARYGILAILLGMSFEEYNSKFDKGGYYDSSIEDWFEKEKQKFKKEFEKFDEYNSLPY